jgi:hypothetical protein
LLLYGIGFDMVRGVDRCNLVQHFIRQRLDHFRRALFQRDSFTPHLVTPVYSGQLQIIRVEKKLRFPLQAVETHLFHLKVEIPRASVRQISGRTKCAKSVTKCEE